MTLQKKMVVGFVAIFMSVPAFGAGLGSRHKRFAGNASWWRQLHQRQEED